MTPFQSTCLIIFSIVAYMMWVDENVATYLTLVFRMTKLNLTKFLWMIRFHPRNPITNLIKEWEYAKIAKELQKEFNDRLSDSD